MKQLDNFDNWCCHNHMIINTDKTKGMLLTTHAKQSKLTDDRGQDLNITMRGKEIKMHLKRCYLGLALTVVFHGNKLKFKRLDALFYSSCQSLEKFANIYQLGSEFYIIITTSRLTFYTAALYGASVVKKIMETVIKLQKQAARLVLDADSQAASAPLFSKLNWQTFNQILHQRQATLISL